MIELAEGARGVERRPRRSACVDRRGFLVATVGAAIIPWRMARSHDVPTALVSGFELPQPKALQPFLLRTHLGMPISKQDLRTRWSFVFFGFTNCPDVCPTAMAELRDLRAAINASNNPAPTRILFVTIDPARDTDERLAAYVAKFGPGVTGVSGSDMALAKFAAQFRVRYEVAARGKVSQGGYLFDHTASVSLVGPDSRLYAVFTLPLRTSQVASDVLRIHAKHRAGVCPGVSGKGETLSCIARDA